ncbi:MAG: hypothetical protein ABSG65_14750 [Bryobacteraceae bacterium]|jgi:hypothetical protein
MKQSTLTTFVVSTFLCAASAQTTVTEGSTTTHRANVDSDSGEVYIYIGGSFSIGTSPTTFTFLWDFVGRGGNSTGYITPLLLERVPGPFYTVYLVRAIGQGFPVAISASPQTIPFTIVEGVITTNAEFTFGYVNAMLNASGQEVASSAGTVDMDYPADSGPGVGGSNTFNTWAATGAPQPITVALGTTIGGDSGTDIAWVNYYPQRTYSAQAQGTVSTQ